MLQATIDEYKQRRISEAEYLIRVEKIMNNVLAHNDDSFPESISKNTFAKAVYGISKEFLNEHDASIDDISTISLKICEKIDEIFHTYKIVNWKQNKDSIDDMKLDMFDFMYDDIKKPNSLEATMTDIDLFVEKCL
jgi:type I restriction enzyme R subunit